MVDTYICIRPSVTKQITCEVTGGTSDKSTG